MKIHVDFLHDSNFLNRDPSMRKPHECHLRFESVDWASHDSAIGFEQLEHRLALSAVPFSADFAADAASYEPSANMQLIGGRQFGVSEHYESVAQHNLAVAYDAAPSDSTFDTAAPFVFGADAVFGLMPSSGLPVAGLSNLAADFVILQGSHGIESFTLTPSHGAIAEDVVSLYGPNVVVTSLTASNNNSDAQGNDLAVVGGPNAEFAGADKTSPDAHPDNHGDAPPEFGPGVSGRNNNSAIPAPVAAFGADSMARTLLSTSEAPKQAMPPAPSAPILPSQITTPAGDTNDVGIARGQLAQSQFPQGVAGVLQTPAATLPQVSPNVRGSVGATSAPAEKSVEVAKQEAPIAVTSTDSNASVAEGQETSLQIEASRAVLLASVPLDLAAVDQSLATMFNEIERLGGELVTWLDEANAQPWVTAVTVAAACWWGGRYILRRRAGQSLREQGEEASSSWLFTRMHSPAVQS